MDNSKKYKSISDNISFLAEKCLNTETILSAILAYLINISPDDTSIDFQRFSYIKNRSNQNFTSKLYQLRESINDNLQFKYLVNRVKTSIANKKHIDKNNADTNGINSISKIAVSLLSSIKDENILIELHKQNYKLHVIFSLDDKQIIVLYKYNEKYDIIHTYSKSFLNGIINVLKYINNNSSDSKIIDLPILSDKEYNKIVYDWNKTDKDYPKNKTIHQLFEEQVLKTPDNIAVVFQDRQLSYKDLNAKANQLARYLKSHSEIKPDTLVASCLDRSLEMIIGILGIIKAGAAYVPIDPEYPTERIKYILNDTKTDIILTQSHLVEKLQKTTNISLIDLISNCYKDQNSANLPIQNKSTDLAYVIYTSGTTGNPKGVMIGHKSLVNRLIWQKKVYSFTESDKIIQKTPFVFDVSVWELLLPLISGSKLIFAKVNGHKNPEYLYSLLQSQKITKLHFVPSMLKSFCEYLKNYNITELNFIKQIFCSGEILPLPLVNNFKNLFPNIQLNNLYGPTEATIDVSSYNHIPANINSIHIGKPIQNINFYVLGFNKKLTPVGVIGELHIGGVCLAKGYLNKPKLTAEKFISNPFATKEDIARGYTKLYKTGDLVRWLPGGNIEYIGRNDNQVKIRGYRIELGEIESKLSSYPSISQCAVTVYEQPLTRTKQLTAYYTVDDITTNDDIPKLKTSFIHNWKNLYNSQYSSDSDIALGSDFSGWNSSYTEKLIPLDEMYEWQNAALQRILSLNPENVYEIGCGTGLIMYPLLKNINHYIGIDFSSEVIEKLKSSFEKSNIYNSKVFKAEAYELDSIEFLKKNRNIDTVIINSVAQYFPNIEYLEDVLIKAINLIDKGRVFIGDIRDYRLLKEFHSSVEIFKYLNSSESKSFNISDAVSNNIRNENELLVAPEYFIGLKDKIARIKCVQILPKRGKALHEMNKYRYDVIIHIVKNKASENRIDLNFIDYNSRFKLNHIMESDKDIIFIRNYPNKRIYRECKTAEYLSEGNENIIHKYNEFESIEYDIHEIDELYSFSEANNYNLDVSLSLDDKSCYDLLFYKGEVQGIKQKYFEFYSQHLSKVTYSNNPLSNVQKRKIDVDKLRTFLSEKLPDYMIPNAFAELENFPLTVNGKLDRKTLPAPEFTNKGSYVAPITDLELKLCTIWQNILCLEKVGIRDNFFRIGGNSILAIQLAYAINKTIKTSISTLDILKSKNIEDLANCINIKIKKIEIFKEECTEVNQLHHFEKMMLLDQTVKDEPLINSESFLVQLEKSIDFDRYSKIANYILAKYEVLNSNYVLENECFQRKIINRQANCKQIKLKQNDSLTNKLTKLVSTPFDIAKNLLIRFYLIDQAEQQYIFISLHHAILDATSIINIILPEFYKIITAPELMTPTKQKIIEFNSFSWSLDKYYAENYKKSIKYWTDELSTSEPVSLSKNISKNSNKGAQLYFTLNSTATEKLHEISKELQVSLYSLLFSTFTLLIHRVSNKNSIAIRTNIDERIYFPKYKNIIGCFINNLFIMSTKNEDILFGDYAKKMHSKIFESLSHPIKFSNLLDYDRELIELMSEIHFNIETEETESLPYEQSQVYSHSEYVKNSLYFEVDAKQDHIYCRVEYQLDKYDTYLVSSLTKIYEYLLLNLNSNINSKTSQISLLSPYEYQTIVYDWNKTEKAYPKDKTIHQLFEEQVEKTPDNIAVVFEEQKLTYAELNAKANQLARYLKSQTAIKPDTLIALCLDRSLEMIIGILGILKTGSAYVPIAPEYPAERIRYILNDTETQLILTKSNLVKRLENITDVKLIGLDSDCYHCQKTTNLTIQSKSTDLAYIIYTSGSTGKPKGVMAENTAIVNRFNWMWELYPFKKEDVSLFKTNYVFVDSIWELFGPILKGIKCIIFSNNLDFDRLIQIINKYQITRLSGVIEYLANINYKEVPSIKLISSSGSSINYNTAKIIIDADIKLLNLYGSSEVAADVTYYEYTKKDINNFQNKIGKNIANIKSYVLDTNNKPVPIGIIGELHISGAGIARGYLNKPDLTTEKFISNPFATKEDIARGYTKLYKTGDLVRWLPDGNIEYIGRNDDQVKIRGHRIELGEIESTLNSIEGIKQSCVLAKEFASANNSSDATNKYLVAYYVLNNTTLNIQHSTLREELSVRLPSHMIPNTFVEMKSLPLTINGKLDKKALPNPEFTTEETYIAPTTDLEIKLCSIWQKVLGIEKIGINNNFFRVGGNSILALKLLHKMNLKLNCYIAIADIFKCKTISRLADYL